MPFLISLFLLFVSRTFATEGDSCQCSLSATQKPAQQLGKIVTDSCEIQRKMCEGKFADDKDLQKYIRNCQSPEPEYSTLNHVTQCLVLFPQPLIDSVKSLVVAAASMAKDNIRVTKDLIELCQSDEDVRLFMISQVPLLKGYNDKPANAVLCASVIVEFQEWARNQKQNKTLAKVTDRNFQFYLEGKAQKANPFQGDPLFNKIWRDQKEKFDCLSNYGKTYLSCYYLFSVVDPTLLLGFGGLALKSPKLEKAFDLITGQVKKTEDSLYPKFLQEKRFLVGYEQRFSVDHRIISASQYDRSWLLATAQDLKNNERYFREAIKRGDPQIKFLEDIGFKFDFEKGHRIPNIKEINQKIDQKMKDLVRSGRIKEDQVFMPARIFEIVESGNRKVIPVRLGEEPPTGAILFSSHLTGQEFSEFANQGFWPMGEMVKGGENAASVALHDLGHFGAFTRNPSYMGAIRDFMKARVGNGNYPPFDPNFAFESLALGKKEALTHLSEDFKKVGISLSKTEPKDVADYFKRLKDVPDKEINDLVAKQYEKREIMVEDYGGLRNDITSKARSEKEGHKAYSYLGNNPRGLIEMAQQSMNATEKKELLAKYLSAMDYSSRIAAADVIKAITYSDNIPKNSLLHKYVCTAGIYSNKSPIFSLFCR